MWQPLGRILSFGSIAFGAVIQEEGGKKKRKLTCTLGRAVHELSFLEAEAGESGSHLPRRPRDSGAAAAAAAATFPTLRAAWDPFQRKKACVSNK